MVVKKLYNVREDGVKLYYIYSDENKYIHKEGTDEIYEDALDVEDAPYTYIETDIEINHEEPFNMITREGGESDVQDIN